MCFTIFRQISLSLSLALALSLYIYIYIYIYICFLNFAYASSKLIFILWQAQILFHKVSIDLILLFPSLTRSSQRDAQPSILFLLCSWSEGPSYKTVSILGKFISQENFKSVSTMSKNNSNDDSEQENHRQPNFIAPV